jgi:hypothetical protein
MPVSHSGSDTSRDSVWAPSLSVVTVSSESLAWSVTVQGLVLIRLEFEWRGPNLLPEGVLRLPWKCF